MTYSQKSKSFIVTHSKANFLSKEDVKNSKKKYFVTLEEHEKLYREKELFRSELDKLNKVFLFTIFYILF
jgi:hypothetical protein